MPPGRPSSNSDFTIDQLQQVVQQLELALRRPSSRCRPPDDGQHWAHSVPQVEHPAVAIGAGAGAGAGTAAPAGVTPAIGGAGIAATVPQVLHAVHGVQQVLEERPRRIGLLVEQVEHGEPQVWQGAWQHVV